MTSGSADEVDLAPALAWVGSVAGPPSDVQVLVGGWTSLMLAMSTPVAGDVVLRLMTREPWRSHGPELTARESEVQSMLAPTAVPAPVSLVLDAAGDRCGVAAHLMSRIPGAIRPDRRGSRDLDALAGVLAAIHDIEPTVAVRAYQSWAWEAKHVVPTWASDHGVWGAAFALLREPPPAHEPTFLHRDFGPRNVLWSGDRVSGVVDWVETSIGPAWLDVAHGATNLAITGDDEAADGLAAAYVRRTGRAPQPYFDVMDVVGFLPPPGRPSFFDADGPEHPRLERRLRAVLDRL